MKKRTKNKIIVILIIFVYIIFLCNESFSFKHWLRLYQNGAYSIEKINDETFQDLVSALRMAGGEIQQKETFKKYKKCYDNLCNAAKNQNLEETYYFEKYDLVTGKEISSFNMINSKIGEAEKVIDDPPSKEEVKEAKDSFKKYTQQEYSECTIENKDEYWEALEESSNYIEQMTKKDLNLYVQCLNAFKNSPGGIALTRDNPEVQEKINSILIEISALHKDRLNKESKKILKDAGIIEEKRKSPVYLYPNNESDKKNAEENLDDVINDANNFIKIGNINISEKVLMNFSKTMYNILLAVGVVVAVIMGGIIGIKLMIGSIEEQVKAKKLLVPYVAGCVIVFGGFGIWKLIVTMMSGV